MKRLVFAIAVAVASAAICGSSIAAPIAAVPAVADNNVVQAYYYRGHYYPYRWHGHYYPYRWNGHYYGHRRYWHGHYRYW